MLWNLRLVDVVQSGLLTLEEEEEEEQKEEEKEASLTT